MAKDFLETAKNFNDFSPPKFGFAVKINRQNQKVIKTEICERWISFDSETAHNHDDQNPMGWIYQWAFKFGETIVIGRRPSEFVRALERLYDAYELGSSRKIIVYVHNLSYDVSYLWQWLSERFGTPKILAVKARKYITFAVKGFIFKCSYKLSNKSLAVWGNDLGVQHKKLAEESEYYDEIHYQDEELTPDKWEYQIRDVVTLDECVEKQMEAYNDTILTIPLTSTGYVRRDARRHYKEDRRNRKRFLLTRLDEETYYFCREEFGGGLTHGNRFFAGKTVSPEPDKGEFIRHRDFRSHYPSQQRAKRGFPVGKFVRYGQHLSIDKIRELTQDFCIIMKVVFENVTIRKCQILPVISVSKAYKHRFTKLDIVEDNGRALEIKGVFALYLTEYDLHWILKQYDIESYDIETAYVAPKGYIPEYLGKTVDEYFYGKTRWKKELNAEKAKGESADKERLIYLALELMKSKNGLNGIYGMSATDIVRELYAMDESGEWSSTRPEVSSALDEYYKSENSFNRYQLGIYTTSLARHELLEYHEIIMNAGGTVLYVDTDSIFYVSNASVEKAIEDENERRKAKALEHGAYIEYEGKKVTYDSFDDEEENITRFRFLHAKCYAYETTDEKGKVDLHCTIAGVTEYEDATHQFSRVDELGSIEELTKGKVFERCGGTKAKYTNTPNGKYCVNGHEVEAGAACIITPTTKTLKNELDLYDEVIDWEVIS